jgi:cell division protein ZapA (FtsZ GTPase activity inhibitor)
MCSDFVNAGALGGIRGSLRRVANDLEQQNHAVSALARQVQIANQWQATAFNLQSELAEWQTWGRKMKAGWNKEEQVSADLRQQLEQSQNRLAQAQEALRAEKKLRDDEFNERVVKYNKLVRKSNKLVRCVNAIKAQPGNAVALITALEAEMKAQQA